MTYQKPLSFLMRGGLDLTTPSMASSGLTAASGQAMPSTTT
jgi:hypothetical protein